VVLIHARSVFFCAISEATNRAEAESRAARAGTGMFQMLVGAKSWGRCGGAACVGALPSAGNPGSNEAAITSAAIIESRPLPTPWVIGPHSET
jgi:hypothetical protein